MAGRTITIYLDADTKKADAGIQGFTSSLGNMARVAAAAFAGSQVVGWLVDATKAAAEAEASQDKFAAALARAGMASRTGELQEYNSELSRLTGYDDDLIADAGAILSRFTSDADALKDAERAALDYATATGKTVPAAADAIAKASMGSTRALKSLGIDYTATGDKATDFANVVDLVNDKVGGTASMDGAAKDLRSLETIYGDLQEEIGQLLLPVLDDLAEGFAAAVDAAKPMLDAFEDLSEGVDLARESMEKFELPDWLTDNQNISATMGQFLGAFGPLGDAFRAAGEASRRNEEQLQAMGLRVDETTGQLVQLEDAAADAAPTVDDLTDAVTDSAQSFRTYRQSVIDWKAAIDEASTAAEKNTGAVNKQNTAFRTGTEKGREAESAMLAVADATEAAWKAATDEGKHARAQEILRQGRESLVKQGEKWGLTREAAEDYAAEVLNVPDSVTTRAIFDSSAADRAIDAYLAKWRSAFSQVQSWWGSSGSGGGGGAGRSAPVPQLARASTYATAPMNVTIQAGIGDPVAIAREIDRLQRTRRNRLGL